MNKLFFLPLMLLLFSCVDNNYPKEFSQEALSQPIYNTTGEKFTIAEVLQQNKGATLVLDIWASWCKDCVASMPKIAKVQQQFPKVKFIMISVDEQEQKWKEGIDKFVKPSGVKAEQYTFNTGWKKGKPNDFIDFIGLDWIPRYMVIDKTGKIIYFYSQTITDEGLLQVLSE